MKIGAIIQARAGSTRLPRKILRNLPFGGKTTVLQQAIRRLKKSRRLGDIIVATTVGKEDNDIVDIARRERVKHQRGSNRNVLSRYYSAAKNNNLDVIIRVTSDCPCVDPQILDLMIERHIKTKSDYTSNCVKRSYPHGLDIEVFNFDTLEKAYKNAKRDYEKEHVTPYIIRQKRIFKITEIKAPKNLYAPNIRITLDTEEDYALLCAVFDYLYPKKTYFNAYDILNLFRQKPWLKLINEKVRDRYSQK